MSKCIFILYVNSSVYWQRTYSHIPIISYSHVICYKYRMSLPYLQHALYRKTVQKFCLNALFYIQKLYSGIRKDSSYIVYLFVRKKIPIETEQIHQKLKLVFDRRSKSKMEAPWNTGKVSWCWEWEEMEIAILFYH